MRYLIGPSLLVTAVACHHAPAAKPVVSGQPDNAAKAGTEPDLAAPAGMKWIDREGDFALAATDEDNAEQSGEYVEMSCEVWNLKTHQKVGVTDGMDVSAGGAEPTCDALSPMGTMVEWGNGRNTVWKTWKNEVTACRGVVAPDDSSCIEVDTTPMMFAGADAKGDDLELAWSKATVDGPTKLVYTVKDGLDRNYDTERWWTVTYCSTATAVIDDKRAGTRVVIDAATGNAKVTKAAAGSPACP